MSAKKKQRAREVVSRSGRFDAGPDATVAEFTESVSYDWRLWQHDILGSMAHASMLRKVGILSERELESILNGLEAIARRISEGKFRWRPELEDVHMNIEAELTRHAPAGAKLHTGRSRNDQVALDVRMWLRDELVALGLELRDLQRALVTLGESNRDVVIPGYTHLQRAQPVFFAHHLLAYVEAIERDHGRIGDCYDRTNVCPLGAGALAGSTLPLDREVVAKQLGFADSRGRARICANSMDAVSDRDFVVEFLAAAALIAVHLSRLSEDLILWASEEFGFVRIADAYTTGSSIMPQKRNPDVAELTRGKTGRVIGNLMSVLTLLKGLPMAYNRDLQEDKERLFDTTDTVRACVRMMGGMFSQTEVRAANCQAAASDPQLLATDLADYLVQKGMPFREAHYLVGKIVGLAEKSNKPLDALTAKDLRRVSPKFGSDARDIFDLAKAMQRRNLPGAPGTRQVRRQLAKWTKKLRKPVRQD